jgi:hypothetical protein
MVCTASVIALLRSAGCVAVLDGRLQARTLIDKIIIAAKSFLIGFIAFSFKVKSTFIIARFA